MRRRAFPHGKTAKTGAPRAKTSLSALGAAVSAGTEPPFVNSCAGGISLLEAYGGELLLLRSRQTSPPQPASALRQSGNLRLRTFSRGGSIPADTAAPSAERLVYARGAPVPDVLPCGKCPYRTARGIIFQIAVQEGAIAHVRASIDSYIRSLRRMKRSAAGSLRGTPLNDNRSSAQPQNAAISLSNSTCGKSEQMGPVCSFWRQQPAAKMPCQSP